MIERRRRFRWLAALAGLAAMLGASAPGLAGWSHPPGSVGAAVGGVAAGSTQITVTVQGAALTATATAVSAGVTSRLGNGAVTTYGSPTGITVTVTYFGATLTFHFADLAAAAQTQLIPLGQYSITATPNAAAQSIVLTSDGDGIGPLAVPLSPPGPVNTTAGNPPAPQPSPTSTGAPPAPGGFQTAADEAQRALALCGTDTRNCVADVLDAYARKLELLSPNLPAELKSLPTIVRSAAGAVRAAKTKAQALAGLRIAIVATRKAINLIRVDNADLGPLGLQAARSVEQTLQRAKVDIVRATDL